jgi:hypothetical protein
VSLKVYREDPDRPEGVVTCDAEYAEDCHFVEELGVRPGASDADFHELVVNAAYGWSFEARHQQYACPPCTVIGQQRRSATALAREGFPAPFGVGPRSELAAPTGDRAADG